MKTIPLRIPRLSRVVIIGAASINLRTRRSSSNSCNASSRERQRVDRSGFAPALREDHVCVVCARGHRPRRDGLPSSGRQVAAVWQGGGEFCAWHVAVFCDRDANPGGAIPLVAKSYEGRPIKVEGNALFPAAMAARIVFAQASILNLYDPDRATRFAHACATVSSGEAPEALTGIANKFARQPRRRAGVAR